MQLRVGTRLNGGKYEIVSVLGQGGFGITYLGLNVSLHKKVAIKEFFINSLCNRESDTLTVTASTPSNKQLTDRHKEKFLKEARSLADISNPGIVSVIDLFEENNTAYYVMDYIDGESLKDIITRRGTLTEKEAMRYIRAVGDAVSFMHSKRMNHLDLKPANIMVDRLTDRPILIDFGTAKHYDSSGNQTSSMMPGFTEGFAPMEQCSPGGVAEFTPQTDVYALGATLYAMLTGQKPPHYSAILESGGRLPALPHHVTPSTANAIRHAMQVSKNQRPESVAAFLSELSDRVFPDDETIVPIIVEPGDKRKIEKVNGESVNSEKDEKKDNLILYTIGFSILVFMLIFMIISVK